MITRETDDVVVLNILMGSPGKKYTAEYFREKTGMQHNTFQRVVNKTIPIKYGIEILRRFKPSETETGKNENFKEYWFDPEKSNGHPFTRNWRQTDTPCPIDGSWYVEDGVCNLCAAAGRKNKEVSV